MAEDVGEERKHFVCKSAKRRPILLVILVLVIAAYGTSNDTCDYAKIGIWRNCGFPNTTRERCQELKCCYASEKFVTSKNLTQNCVRQPESFEWKNGTCHRYNGTVCLAYLGNSTMNKEIFFDVKYGVNGTEEILKQFIALSLFSVKESALCKVLIPTGICQLMLPQCDQKGRPIFPCREDCDVIHRICDKELYRFFGALELHQTKENIKFSHLAMPNCPDYKYSHDYPKNETCLFADNIPCMNISTGSQGTIYPHMSYGKYMPNLNCTWHITVPVGFIVKLTFSMLDVEVSADCTNDYVIVKDGLQRTSRTLNRICGKQLPKTIEGSSNQISIQFVTNDRVEARGFVIKYEKSIPAKPDDNMNLVTIVAISCTIVVFIILVAAAAIVWKRRAVGKQKLKEEEEKKDMELFTTITTVRDRIRQDSMPNPLIAALSQLSPDQKPPQCRLDRMEYVRDLGQGQFGKVYQGRYKITENAEDTSVAVKMLKEGSSTEAKESFVQEVTLMSVLQHENILKLLAVSIEEEPFCMVFEFMSNGDLNQYLRKYDPENIDGMDKAPLSTDVLMDMAIQIAKGMEYLALKRFVHRDLATRNCLVGDRNVVKIADFGMSRDVYESDYYRVGGAVMLPIRWMPPEALIYGRFTVESDVYSYGVLLWEIFTYALQPFYGYSNDEVVKFIRKGVILPKPDVCPEEIYENIMTKCWYKEPEKRLNFTEIYKRLEGDYEFTLDQPKISHREKEAQLSSYSSPPSLKKEPEQKEDLKRIPSKKTNAGGSVQYVNIQMENESQANKIKLGVEDGAFQNPTYRESTVASDLYDVPKSYASNQEATSEGEMEGMTLEMPSFSSRANATADNLYDQPKSTPADAEFGIHSNRSYGMSITVGSHHPISDERDHVI